MSESFEKFVQNLPDDKKAEFFRALHTYTAYYGEIPASINNRRQSTNVADREYDRDVCSGSKTAANPLQSRSVAV